MPISTGSGCSAFKCRAAPGVFLLAFLGHGGNVDLGIASVLMLGYSFVVAMPGHDSIIQFEEINPPTADNLGMLGIIRVNRPIADQ